MDKSNSPTSMTEHLSALLDDETGSFEQKRVLDELKSNTELSRKLSCYALIGETMRSGEIDKPVLSLGSDFLAGIHEKIKAEDEYHDIRNKVVDTALDDGKQSHSKSWLRPVGGFALAASVAAIAVVGLQNYQHLNQTDVEVASNPKMQEVNPGTATFTMPPNTMIAVNDELATDSEQYKQADAQTRLLLKRYVDSHMQYASTAAFVPSVRVIAYADNQ